jgi:tetratricopeptide (TPR) repeat protein
MADKDDDDVADAASDSSAIEDDELVEVDEPPAPPKVAAIPPPRLTQAFRPPVPAPPPLPRPVVAIPPRTPIGSIPALGAKPPAIPSPRSTPPAIAVPPLTPPPTPPSVAIPPPVVAAVMPDPHRRDKPPTEPPPLPRTKTADHPPSESGVRAKRGTAPPPLDGELESTVDLSQHEGGGVEVSTGVANIIVDQPLDAQLESPTVVDRAIAELADSGGEQHAEALAADLETKLLDDPAAAAQLAYELGEFYERRLADEARAVKAYGRALNLDPSLRPNLWAIRRVFYRRALWPNLAKLVDAEVNYARDDYERADLLLEKARVCYRMTNADEARASLDEAARIAPHHQGVLLELERVVARAGDQVALLDVWERLADAVEQPARKIAYWLEVGRAAGVAREVQRAQEAFDKAAQLAVGHPSAERVARERLRVAEEHGNPDDIATALEALAQILLAAFGPAGPGPEVGTMPLGERPDRATALRRELLALRRRQSQLARVTQPDRAWELLQQALAMSPGEPTVLADMTELAEELGRYAELAELVQSWQAVEGDPARAMVLSIRRADALLRGGQRDQARALLASLEAAAPGFIVLTSAAERDALGRGDPADLAKTYIVAAHAALLGTWLGPGQTPRPDPASAATLYVQASELLAYEVGTPEALAEARAVLGKALEAVPDHLAALEALTELDDTTGQVADALARLRAAAANATGEARRAIVERAIRLARGHGDLEAVVELERALVELVPGETELEWRLDSTLSQLGRDDERAELLVKLAAHETDAASRGTALLGAARLRERAGAVEAATDLYRQVLALWPEDTFSRESLLDLLRAQERWAELVEERRAEARALPDGPAARRALREAAWVLEIRLDDPAQAAGVYDEWLARTPDDLTALEGGARCRALAGDRPGEVGLRTQLAELAQTPGAQWLQARAFERAGQYDEAADHYRVLIARDDQSVAATTAALALGDLAAARGDTVMRVESTAALAGRTVDPRLGAALAEDSGWLYALVLEDFERAAQSFEAAISLEPTRRGAQLGAALVAAKRSEPAQLAQAYEGLAASVQMPEAAAAMLLRAAAMGVANGDLDLANQRVQAARVAAPDDASALLVVAETMPAPQVDAADPFGAVDPLLARAEVLEMRSALADDPAARASWELDRAEALELAGRLRESVSVVTAVLKGRPDDLRALSALRRMANRANDKATWAQASYQLARLIGDRAAKLQLLREAASVFDAPGLSRNTDYALATYKRIVGIERGAPEYERLLELLRERADVRGLISAITDRLTWIEAESGAAPEAMVPLLLERATVLHGLQDTAAAMADLDALLDRVPNNIEALRFRADLSNLAGEVDTAIALWRRYLAAETRPQRRAEIELQLSQVLAENVNDVAGAIEQLEHVLETNPEDAQLRERLLGLCLRTNDWERAIRELRSLARLRPTPQEKAREELRLGLMLRDRVNDRTGARLALDRARALDPLNLDVVRELADLLEPGARAQVLAATAASLRASIAQSPSRGLLYERLAQVNAWQAELDARWLALAAVEALATPTIDQRQVLAQGRQQLGAPIKLKLADASRAALRGALGGPLLELWRAIAPAVQIATGVDPGKLGFARGDKIAAKKLGDKQQALVNALACFGVEDVELYVSAGRAGLARAFAGETPILCVGADVAAGGSPQHRFMLGRAVATIAEGVATLPELRDGELAWTVVAALRAVDATVPPELAELVAGDDASIAERTKVLKKEINRKAKAVVVQLAQKRGELVDVDGLRRAALAVGHRAGLLWCGDLTVALAQLDVGTGGRALIDSPAALDLVAWSVSEESIALRDKLGIALKGVR